MPYVQTKRKGKFEGREERPEEEQAQTRRPREMGKGCGAEWIHDSVLLGLTDHG